MGHLPCKGGPLGPIYRGCGFPSAEKTNTFQFRELQLSRAS